MKEMVGKLYFLFLPLLSLMRAEYKVEQETAVLKYLEYWKITQKYNNTSYKKNIIQENWVSLL